MGLATGCEKTGWPIDLRIDGAKEKGRNLALYFLLQEEMCFNVNSRSEEPLALQKLMLKHVKTISRADVKYIAENDFQ